MHFYAWKKGLKTGMYYLRTQAATQAVQFTVEKQDATPAETVGHKTFDADDKIVEGASCTMEAGCLSCGS